MECLRVPVLGAVGFPPKQQGFQYHNSRVFYTGPLSHPDLSALLLAFLLLLSTSFLPHSWFPLCPQLLIPASTSLSSWSQPVPLVCSPGGPCQTSLNTLLQVPVLPHSRSPPKAPSSSLTESLLLEGASGDCLVQSPSAQSRAN